MTPVQILILIKMILSDTVIQNINWSYTDNVLHIRYLDEKGKLVHDAINRTGETIDW